MKDVKETFFIWALIYFLFALSIVYIMRYGNIIPEHFSHIITGIFECSIAVPFVYGLYNTEKFRTKPLIYVKYYFYIISLKYFLLGLSSILKAYNLNLASNIESLALYVLIGSIIYITLVIIILVRYHRKSRKVGANDAAD